MRYLRKLILLSLFLLIPLTFSFAQTKSTSEILGEKESTDTTEELDQKEEEREADFLNQLLLDIPELTDNPSHIITFIDPSEDKSGVQIEIDSKNFNDILSPYTLPALSIGKHELRFKFVDKYGATQILEKDIIIIPRPPIINSPTFTEESLNISGTALSNSEIVLILSSSRDIITLEDTTSEDGTWEFVISNEELTEGIYSFSGYTRRHGYASNLAEAVTFEVGESESGIIRSNGKEIYFKFKDISFENLNTVISDNIDLVILVAVVFTLGFVISSILFSIFRNNSDGKSIKILEKKIKENGKNNKEMTLKEKLSQKEEVSKKKEKKEEKKKEEKIVTKIDFLKDFKMFDPDDEKGKEKDATKKDNIKVTLTSKD